MEKSPLRIKIQISGLYYYPATQWRLQNSIQNLQSQVHHGCLQVFFWQ
jgi:hypothetical protein